MQELNEELQAVKESTKAARGRESSLKEELDSLNQELQRSQKTQRRLQAEKEEREQEVQELRQQIKRLRDALQVRTSHRSLTYDSDWTLQTHRFTQTRLKRMKLVPACMLEASRLISGLRLCSTSPV